jgi:hypothetical protein
MLRRCAVSTLVVLALVGCRKKEAKPADPASVHNVPTKPTEAPPEKAPPPRPPPIVGLTVPAKTSSTGYQDTGLVLLPADPQAVEAAKSLTAEKAQGYLNYLKAAKSTGIGTKPTQEEIQADQAKKSRAQQAALDAAGVKRSDIYGIAALFMQFCGAATRFDMLQMRLEAARYRIKKDSEGAEGGPRPHDLREEQHVLHDLDDLKTKGPEAEKDFISKYGEHAADVLRKYSDEYVKVMRVTDRLYIPEAEEHEKRHKR